MRSITERKRVAALVAEGLNDCEISRQTGIPRGTVRDWRRQPEPAARAPRWGPPSIEALLPEAYAYLLGVYLGDGYLAPPVRGVRQLRVYLDDRYPSIVCECVLAIESIFRVNARTFATTRRTRCVSSPSTRSTGSCFFPSTAPA